MSTIRDPLLTQELALAQPPEILDQHPFFTDWYAAFVEVGRDGDGRVTHGKVTWWRREPAEVVGQVRELKAVQGRERCEQSFRITQG